MTYLQPAIDATLPVLRAEAEARMLSRCTIRRRTGRNAQNEETGAVYPIWETVAADVPVRLAGHETRTEAVPGGERQVARRMAHLPVVTIPADGDYLEITAGENAGLVLEVLEADWADQKTARRVPVEAVQRPEEWDL
jgi:hypothetical protein